jgi:hypothetical protein
LSRSATHEQHRIIFSLSNLFIVLATDRSPYAGEEYRQVKSLSEQEIEALRRGDGMGFAKLAELNHYPVPKHVLDISDELALSSSQQVPTEQLYEEMRLNALALGEKLQAAESGLDRAFEDESINSQLLEIALLEIGKLRAQLRYTHLETHLRQRQLLNPEQILIYDSTRGYHGTEQDHSRHSGMH